MNILKVQNEEAATVAGNWLNKLFEDNSGLPILFLVSGGSAFKILAGLDLRARMTIGVLDERFSNGDENNFLQLRKTDFYSKAEENGCSFIETVPGDTETPEKMAEIWEAKLKKWRNDNPNGIVVITQGIGPDGHTAGIMPYPEDKEVFTKLFESDRWVVGYDCKNKNQFPLRVTVTKTFLINEVDKSVVFAFGGNKPEIVDKINEGKNDLATLPAAIISLMKDVVVFTNIE